MDIGKRLRELREAKGLSQGDIERGAGLLRCYVSRVEHGHTVPSLPTLERWAAVLELELSQVFAVGDEKPEAPEPPKKHPVGAQEQTLLGLFSQIPSEDKPLLISLAREMVKRKGKRK